MLVTFSSLLANVLTIYNLFDTGFGQASLGNYVLVFNSRQFQVITMPRKLLITLNVVKSYTKIIISLLLLPRFRQYLGYCETFRRIGPRNEQKVLGVCQNWLDKRAIKVNPLFLMKRMPS